MALSRPIKKDRLALPLYRYVNVIVYVWDNWRRALRFSIADSAAGRHSDDIADRRCISETERDFRAIAAGRWARLVKML